MTAIRRSTRRRVVLSLAAMAVPAALSGQPAVVNADQTPLPEPGVCQGCQPPLVYHGGPVLGTAGLTITPIYWAPDGYSFPSSYSTIVNQYLTDVAAASSQSDNTFAINPEYYQMSGDTKSSVVYKIDAGSPVNASDAFPQTSTPCDVHPDYTACVNQEQIQNELIAVLAANNLPADLNHVYVILFPPKVQTLENNARSQEVYCGVHGSFNVTTGGTVIYADEPYITSCAAAAGQAPNGDASADTEVSIISHELSEIITDPVSKSPSWYDKAGNEIGDECNFNYGPPKGSTDSSNAQTTEYNQVINGHNYYAQTMFSNAAYATNGVGKGCITTAFNATTQSAFKAAATDEPASATMDAGETRLPADGKSTTKLTLTVLDGNGEPVSGDHIHFGITPTNDTPGLCGTVAKTDVTTDDNGQAETTYTASSQNVACIVIGVDAESGSSDWATVYQGSTSSLQPTITDASVPDSLDPGDSDTFSVTASNPSKSDIQDARFDVFLSGDNNKTSGLTAKQVHLAYADDSTGGKFVDVPLSGETVNDGEIEGYAMPDKAANLPAGGSRTVTFQISLASDAPTSAGTGSPLHIEADFDQFNPADESQNNLDYVGPADVTIGAAGAASSGGGFPLPIIIVLAVLGAAVIVAGVVLVSRRRGQPQAA